jgi:hypothetical protein
MNTESRPRFAFDITDQQQYRAAKLLSTHGMRKALFQPILDDVLDLLEAHGNVVAGLIMDGRVKPREIMPILKRTETKAKGMAQNGNN